MDDKNEQFLRLSAVIAKTGKPKASIYRDIHLGTFPAPEKIGARAVAWRLSRILRWMQAPSAYQED
ncbi:transcriptional regulator, AlpA family [Sphingobium sp. AP50]|uniref:helix-turn-helix transcriptional regulator n=1 Tax=Sphingobium sp. AP50 TaxID=1884369 RepID=UPI0008B76C06|nr:AlpA family phage regulatory protein [Sphingobium sp. AP50]SEK04678.1 transcriptional regulator, AlpA family [Sphingobium sp. AP50]